MVSIMADKKLLDMANKVAGEFNSEKDFEEFTKALRKQFWESTLEGELDDHIWFQLCVSMVSIVCVYGFTASVTFTPSYTRQIAYWANPRIGTVLECKLF